MKSKRISQTIKRSLSGKYAYSVALTMLISAPVAADIDRLQLINGDIGPNFSVAPKFNLNNGVALGEEFYYWGTDLSDAPTAPTNFQTDVLHKADIAGATPIQDQNGNGIWNVSSIAPFNGGLAISHALGIEILEPGSETTVFVSSSVSSASQMLEHGSPARLHLITASNSLGIFRNTTDGLTSIANGVGNPDCPAGDSLMATVGSSTVVFAQSQNGGTTVGLSSTSTGEPNSISELPQSAEVFSSPCGLTSFGSRVYFNALNSSGKRQIWITDGVNSSETKLLRDSSGNLFNAIENAGTKSPRFRKFKEKMLFAAASTADDNYDLWITDGTSANTTRLATFGAPENTIRADLGFEHEGILYFQANTKLFKTDGTAEGTVEVVDGLNSSLNVDSNLSMAFFDGRVHMVDTNGQFRRANNDGQMKVITGIKGTVQSISSAVPGRLLVAAKQNSLPAGTQDNLFTLVPEPTISVQNVTTSEQTATGDFDVRISLSEAVPYEVSGTYNLEAGSALAGQDYLEPASGTNTFTITPADGTTKLITIRLNNDSKNENDEAFKVVLTNVDGAKYPDGGDRAEGTVVITDDDPLVQAGSIEVTDAITQEGANTISVTIKAGGTLEVPVEFSYTVADGTGAGAATAPGDFIAATGTGTIEVGSGNSTTIPVTINDDDLVEDLETFIVTVTPTAGIAAANLNVAVTGIISIRDNDVEDTVDPEPETPVTTPASSGGGGGCSITTNNGGGDPLLPALGLMAGLMLFMRRKLL